MQNSSLWSFELLNNNTHPGCFSIIQRSVVNSSSLIRPFGPLKGRSTCWTSYQHHFDVLIHFQHLWYSLFMCIKSKNRACKKSQWHMQPYSGSLLDLQSWAFCHIDAVFICEPCHLSETPEDLFLSTPCVST